MATLHAALDSGINFFDTADVYGDGLSERLIARLRRERSEPFSVATKAGRRLNPHTAHGYNAENLAAFVDRSLQNLAVELIDLLQLHCLRPRSTTNRRSSSRSTDSWRQARSGFMA